MLNIDEGKIGTHLMIKAVIFDMDGLLIDSEPLWQEAEMEAFEKVNLHLTRENCMETTGFRIDEVVDYWYRQRPWETLTRAEMVEEITGEVIRLIREKGELKPGVRQALEFVKGAGVKTALATSSNYRIVRPVLDKFKLDSAFQVIHSAQEETYGKPHPAVYLTTSRKLNVRPELCLAIEDSLAGVIAAKAAKMFCIAVPEANSGSDERFVLADVQLDSLEALNAELWEHINNRKTPDNRLGRSFS